MPDLPAGEYDFYAGIDPGFQGAVGVINAAGTDVRVWDLPVITKDLDRQREFDLAGFDDLFRGLSRRPRLVLGIEWPSTRPGEGSERSERFGRGKGYLEAFAYCKRIDYYKIVPSLWKGRLNLPGKSDPEANQMAARVFEQAYPEYAGLVRGPRGGIKDGRCDALLIAHFLRSRTVGHLNRLVEQHGKGSDEVLGALLGGQRRKKR